MNNKTTIHVAHVIADSSSVPYFSWFAEKAKADVNIKFSFILLHDKKTRMLDGVAKHGCDNYFVYFDGNNRGKSVINAIPKLYKLFKKIKPDIVHSHLFDDSICSVIAAKLAGIKNRVVTKQDTTYHWFYAPKAVKYDRMINRWATHLVAVSNECKNFILEKEKAPKDKIHLIHHGISLEKLSKATEEFKEELRNKYHLKNKIVIGTVARLVEWKGHSLLLDLAELVVKKYPNIVFLFAGDGEEKVIADLKRTIQEKNLQNHIVFTGWIDREKIPSFYSIMDIYIHAAKYEPFGFVIAEAMLNAAPVLSTKTGSALDAIEHKKSGYLVNYDSVLEFVEGVEFLLNNNSKEIGLKGKETAMKMYDFELMYERYLSLYKNILNGDK